MDLLNGSLTDLRSYDRGWSALTVDATVFDHQWSTLEMRRAIVTERFDGGTGRLAHDIHTNSDPRYLEVRRERAREKN